jgi:acetylornithine/N-succinyldiaminopimelate aminotransferase
MDILQQQDKEYIAGTYARFPLTIEGGKGSVVWDDAGKIYTDLSSGIAVNTFGIADDEWIKAITEQAGKIQHMSNLYYTEPCVKLAQMLCDRTGMKKVFFSNSGAEANECAIKAARKYAAEKHGADCYNIVTLKNSFHGRTITTLAATGQDVFHKDFLPLTEGFIYVEPNDIEKIEKVLFENRCAAVMLEVVQGEGGVMPLDKDYLQSLERICRERDILLICDEVQIGNGRSGKLYSYMNYGIFPDIVSTAKGLAGGLPLGATLFSEKTKDVLTPGSHGSTFGGNPICCAGAINILSRLDEKTLAGVRKRSEYIFSELSGAPGIKEVTGLGLMIGIKTEKDASEVINACIKKGVLVIKAKDKVRLLPALNIPMELLEQAVGVIKEVCADKEA